MGLFNKILGGHGSENTPFTTQEAVACILYISVYIDGHISEEEKELFIGTTNRMKLLRTQSAEEFNAMIRKFDGMFDKHGFKPTLSKAIAAVPAELRETTFALAADLVFADGSVEDDEMAFLEGIQNSLEVPDDRALKIVEVLQIKNRG